MVTFCNTTGNQPRSLRMSSHGSDGRSAYSLKSRSRSVRACGMHRAGLQAQTKAKLLIQLTGPSRHVNGCPFCDDLDPIQQTISVSSKSSSTHPFFQVQSTNPSKVPSRPLTAISTARRSRSNHRFSMHMKLRTCGFHYS